MEITNNLSNSVNEPALATVAGFCKKGHYLISHTSDVKLTVLKVSAPGNANRQGENYTAVILFACSTI